MASAGLTLFVASNSLLLLFLALHVSRLRMKERVANGDKGSLALKKAIRAHANGVEHFVVVGIQLLALQMANAPASWIVVLGTLFTLSRICHAAGALRSALPVRQAGAVGTYACELAGVAALLVGL